MTLLLFLMENDNWVWKVAVSAFEGLIKPLIGRWCHALI